MAHMYTAHIHWCATDLFKFMQKSISTFIHVDLEVGESNLANTNRPEHICQQRYLHTAHLLLVKHTSTLGGLSYHINHDLGSVPTCRCVIVYKSVEFWILTPSLINESLVYIYYMYMYIVMYMYMYIYIS